MKAGVVGATGYVGAELCRWLLGHPELELAAVVSRSRAGQRLGDVIPGLDGVTDLVLADPGALAGLDVVMLATPHGAAAPLVADLADLPVIVDCSADHRHAPGWVYGQPELAREALPGARRIAAPGCFATAMSLAIGPLVPHLAGPVCIAAATGSTGSGADPKPATHHPERFHNLKAYKVLAHQHVPEVCTFLGLSSLTFVPQSAPVDRGIFCTAFVPVGEVDARSIVADAYATAPLVRLRSETPELRHVRGTAFADLAAHQDGGTAVVLVAIDNLGKGAAAQAVQALNLALGLPEACGLLVPGSLP